MPPANRARNPSTTQPDKTITFAGSEIFALLYACAVIGVAIYLLRLLGRLVQAHERIATALEHNEADR